MRGLGCAALFVLGAGRLMAAGTVSDGPVVLSYTASHWDGSPEARLQGTERTPATNVLRLAGWWYRVEGVHTREFPFPTPDSENWDPVLKRLTADWNDLDGTGIGAREETYVIDHEGPSGLIESVLFLENQSSAAQTVHLFHVADFDVGGTFDGDAGTALTRSFLRYSDGANVVRYRARFASHFQMAGSVAAITDALNDSDLDDLPDTATSGVVTDAAAGFQFIDTIPAGSGLGVLGSAVAISSRLGHDRAFSDEFNMGGYPNLMFHSTTGLRRLWLMRRTARSTQYAYFDNGWEWLGANDLRGTYGSQWVERNLTTGALRIGSSPLAGAPSPPTDWRLVATGDFNADGRADLVWSVPSDGRLEIWNMNGATRLGVMAPSPDRAVDPNWDLVGAADYNGDGLLDLLWTNRVSRRLVIWFLDAAATRTAAVFTDPPGATDANWSAVAVGDFGMGAGAGATWEAADVVWQNDVSNRLVVWHMDRAGRRTSGVFTEPPSPGARVIGPR